MILKYIQHCIQKMNLSAVQQKFDILYKCKKSKIYKYNLVKALVFTYTVIGIRITLALDTLYMFVKVTIL